MRNPIAVFLFSIDHKFALLNKIYCKIRLYDVIRPYPFEHYCVFCRRICYSWWIQKKEDLEEKE